MSTIVITGGSQGIGASTAQRLPVAMPSKGVAHA